MQENATCEKSAIFTNSLRLSNHQLPPKFCEVSRYLELTLSAI